MFGLVLLVSLSTALDPTPADINKVCFKCNVYSAAGKMKCENPGVCYANFCYSYVTSDGTTMFLSGCAEDVTDFPKSGVSDGLVCQSSNGVALCVCATGKEACNYPESTDGTEIVREIYWTEREEADIDNISTKVTGFSIDYAQKRLDHLRQDGIERVPMHFNVSQKINSARAAGFVVAIVFSSLLSL